MDKKEILEKYSFYSNSPPAFKKELEDLSTKVNLKKTNYYFFDGDSCQNIALVGKGNIRVFKVGESGRKITLYHVLPGEVCILTASCLLAKLKYPASAIIEEDTEALVFDPNYFRDLVSTNEIVRKFVFETLATRMASVISLVEEVAFKRMDKRLAEYLIKKFEENKNDIQETHEHLASEMGTAREVVSRLLKEFERTGLIELSRGKISLKDIDLLKEYSQE